MITNKGGGNPRKQAVAEISSLLRQALDKLDQISAPPDIGAHVDRAICRLEDLERTEEQ